MSTLKLWGFTALSKVKGDVLPIITLEVDFSNTCFSLRFCSQVSYFYVIVSCITMLPWLWFDINALNFLPVSFPTYHSTFHHCLHFYNYLNKRRSSVDRLTASNRACVGGCSHKHILCLECVCVCVWRWPLSTSVLLDVCVCAQPCLRAVYVLCFSARACVSGSRPSQAYYQDVTEGGRQQPRCLNETWALANWRHHGVREWERQLPDWQDERRGQRVGPSHWWIKPVTFICRTHRGREHLHSSYQNPANVKVPAGRPKMATVTTFSTEHSFPFQSSPFHSTLSRLSALLPLSKS